jgi:glycosyltransferase involved in cell wall biosynthesis
MRRGFDTRKMDIFHRGIDTTLFCPDGNARNYIKNKYRANADVNLLYAGRISEDKNIDFLIEAAAPLFDDSVNLLFAGDGPYLNALKEKHAGNKNILFLGQIPNRTLPLIYAGCDLLVFPSETDTFGMVVLEAQSCGVPALVSNIGGPQNIIVNNETGYVLSVESPQIWTDRIAKLIGMIKNKDDAYIKLCQKARRHVIEEFDVHRILENYVANDENA